MFGRVTGGSPFLSLIFSEFDHTTPLQAQGAADTDAAYTALFNKVGFHVPGSFDGARSLPAAEGSASGYLGEAAAEVEKLDAQIKKQRSEAFQAAFA